MWFYFSHLSVVASGLVVASGTCVTCILALATLITTRAPVLSTVSWGSLEASELVGEGLAELMPSWQIEIRPNSHAE